MFALLFSCNTIIGQQCIDFHENYCISYKNKGYITVPVSRSFKMEKGAYTDLNIKFNKGQDYHINFAVDDIFAQQLFVQIIDRHTNKVIYDNTKDEMSLNMVFSAIKDTNAKIIIETPASKVDSPKYNPEGCIGILIETRPTPQTGFPEEN